MRQLSLMQGGSEGILVPKLGFFVAVQNTGSPTMISSDGINWQYSSNTPTVPWIGTEWSKELGLACCVGTTGPPNIITSPDGVVWTIQTPPEGRSWFSVAWSAPLGLFCAVCNDLVDINSVMTSPDGINWTSRAASAIRRWGKIAWSNELGIFCALDTAFPTDGTNDVMTSPDGINWTTRVPSQVAAWLDLVWSPEKGIFCATTSIGGFLGMTSPDGINWTTHNLPGSGGDGVEWSPQLSLFVTVGHGTQPNLMASSPDAINWTVRSVPGSSGAIFFRKVAWSPELRLFAALSATDSAGIPSGTGQLATSTDGINWTLRNTKGGFWIHSFSWCNPTGRF